MPVPERPHPCPDTRTPPQSLQTAASARAFCSAWGPRGGRDAKGSQAPGAQGRGPGLINGPWGAPSANGRKQEALLPASLVLREIPKWGGEGRLTDSILLPHFLPASCGIIALFIGSGLSVSP